jgi:hypothetical protein
MHVGAAILAACATVSVAFCTETTAVKTEGTAAAKISHDDLLWLNRITYGADTATIDRFGKLGRKKFLDDQLRGNDDRLPTPLQQKIEAMPITHVDLSKTLADFGTRRREMKADGKTDASQEQRKEYAREGADLVRQEINRELLRCMRRIS